MNASNYSDSVADSVAYTGNGSRESAKARTVRLRFSFEARQKLFADSGRWVGKEQVLTLPRPALLSRAARECLLAIDASGLFLGGSLGTADLTLVKELDESRPDEEPAQRKPLRARSAEASAEASDPSANASGDGRRGEHRTRTAQPVNPVLEEVPPESYRTQEVPPDGGEMPEGVSPEGTGDVSSWDRVLADYALRLENLRRQREELAEKKALALIKSAEKDLDSEEELSEATSGALDQAEAYAGHLCAQTKERLKSTADLWRWRYQRERLARSEAARRRREAEEARAARARERHEAEKRRWAEEHGSRRLRRALSAGHDCELTYAAERLALERPQFRLLRVGADGSQPAFDAHPEPSDSALALAEESGGEVVLADYASLAASLADEEAHDLLHRLGGREAAGGDAAGRDAQSEQHALERIAAGACEAVLVGGYLGRHAVVCVLDLSSPSTIKSAEPLVRTPGTQSGTQSGTRDA